MEREGGAEAPPCTAAGRAGRWEGAGWCRRLCSSDRSRIDKTLVCLWAVNIEDEAASVPPSVSLGIIERNCLQSSLMGCPIFNNGLSN